MKSNPYYILYCSVIICNIRIVGTGHKLSAYFIFHGQTVNAHIHTIQNMDDCCSSNMMLQAGVKEYLQVALMHNY